MTNIPNKEATVKRRGKTISSPPEPRNGRASDSVSDVRINDSSSSNDVRGVGVPELQSNPTPEPAKEVLPNPPQLGTREPVTFNVSDAMAFEEKLDLLNAYKKLLSKPIKLQGKTSVVQEIQIQYNLWIHKQISNIFNSESSKIKELFTAEEAEALKMLATKILTTAKNPQQQQPTQQPNRPQGPPRPAPSPLKEAVNTQKLRQDQIDLIAKLEKMDRDGPQF